MVGTLLPAVPPAALRELLLSTARAIEPLASMAVGEAGEPLLRREGTKTNQTPLVQFCSPMPLPDATCRALEKAGRLRPVTLAALLLQGAEAFAWIKPGEALDGLTDVPKAGAFAYVFKQGTLQTALAASGLHTSDGDEEDDAGASSSSRRSGFEGYFPAAREGCFFPVAV